MKVKKFYVLNIECENIEEYQGVKNLLNGMNLEMVWDFEESLTFQVEYLDKCQYNKIIKSLKK